MGDSNHLSSFGDSLADVAEPYLESTFATEKKQKVKMRSEINSGYNDFESLEEAGRFFIVIYNSTTTVSAAYATFIALAIAGAIGAILGLIYWTFLSSKSEPSSYEAPAPHDGYGFFKREGRDYQESLDFVKIVNLIERMEKHLAEFDGSQDKNTAGEECISNLFRICQNFSTPELRDELLGELLDEARILLTRTSGNDEKEELLRTFVGASQLGSSKGDCRLNFC